MANGVAPFSMVSYGKAQVPCYVIEFDKEGQCKSPRQRDALVAALQMGAHREVHIYSHGWNNVFDVAMARYKSFFENYLDARKLVADRGLASGNGSAADLGGTAFVGIIWPSTVMLATDERSPKIGALPAVDDATRAAAGYVADAVGVSASDLVTTLEIPEIGGADVERFLEPFLKVFAKPDDETSVIGAADAFQLSALLYEASIAAADNDGPDKKLGNVYSPDKALRAEPKAGGRLPFPVDPRQLVRVASVYVMKDRARAVGIRGVGPQVLGPTISKHETRVHLIGHSFGCAVMLSALCSQKPVRPVHSVMLLEPAVSWLCLASNVGDGRSGGYVAAPQQTAQPLLTTYSSEDRELTTYYPLAMRRLRDVGEPAAAAIIDNEPYRALGGSGPSPATGQSVHHADLIEPGLPYRAMPNEVRIIALNGAPDKITSHGDVDNRFTAWAHAWAAHVGFQ